ncbi:MAG: replication initiator protein A [Selenomonas sp.]|nr:replication initiator protein A [Selenomonas sp.]
MGVRFTKYNYGKTQFYQLPKSMFLVKKYRELSSNAKIIYTILLDKIGLSYRNKYFDDNGDIFIYYKWDDLIEFSGIAKTTFYKELGKLRELDLIHTIKQPFTNTNKIYVSMLDDAASDEELYEDKSETGFYAADNIEELEFQNKTASMEASEMEEAIAEGQLNFPRKQRGSIILSQGKFAMRTSEFGNGTTPGANANFPPDITRLSSDSEPASSIYEQTGSEIEPASSELGVPSSDSELLYSKTKSKTEVTRQQVRGKRGETGARARILVENPSNPPAQTAMKPDATLAQGHSERGDSAPVDNFSTGEEAKAAPAQDGFAEVFALYSDNIQPNPVPLVKNALRNLFDKHGKDALTEAITQAALSSTAQEKKGYNYVASIVARIAGNKANNFTDYSQVAPAQKVSGSDVKVMPRYSKPVQHSMIESRENIHNMIDSFFGADNGGNGNDGTDKAGAC